jgi:hypothetical protein
LTATLIALALLNGCVVVPQTLPQAVATASVADAALQEYSTGLALDFARRDLAALEERMAERFRLGTWQADGRVVSPEEAAEVLQESTLGPAQEIIFDSRTDLEAMLGRDPTGLWGDGVEIADVLFVRGLGADGAGEALISVGIVEPGQYEWSGMISAPEGFGSVVQAEAVETVAEALATESDSASTPEAEMVALADGAVASDVNELGIVGGAELLDGPSEDAEVIGSLEDGASAAVLGRTEDGLYWLVACPAEVAESDACWLKDDPERVEPVAVEGSAPVAEDVSGSSPEATPLATTPTPEAMVVASDEAIVDVNGIDGAERIEFGVNEVAASRRGTLEAGIPKLYVIRVKAGQAMTIDLISDGEAANFSVTGAANGQPYKELANEERLWTFTVPVTQDYVITLENAAESEYTLTVIVPPIAPQPAQGATSAPESEPTQYSEAIPAEAEDADQLPVESGETALNVTEIVSPRGSDEYVVGAYEGQTMVVSVESPEDIVNFSVLGVEDGQPLKRLENEDREWSGELPATQDYLITVVNPRGVRVQYSLNVAFSPLD